MPGIMMEKDFFVHDVCLLRHVPIDKYFSIPWTLNLKVYIVRFNIAKRLQNEFQFVELSLFTSTSSIIKTLKLMFSSKLTK